MHLARAGDRIIAMLRAQLARLRRKTFGTSSEKLAREIEQLELALEEYETVAAGTDACAPVTAEAPERPASVRALPPHLPRHEVGCPWRDMHERYGKWNSVYVRFRRWAGQGVWDALLQTLVELGLTDDWQHMIDSTSVRGHVSAAGGKGGLVRTLLVDHAAALRAKSTPDATIKDCLSASS